MNQPTGSSSIVSADCGEIVPPPAVPQPTDARTRVTARPFLVGIAGGTGSGKTTLAGALADTFGRDRAVILAQDAYYRDRGDVAPEARDALNYDVPDALDQALFLAHLRRLRTGYPVSPPVYCFVTHCRRGTAAPIEPREVVLVEGILLLHDPDVRAELDLTIFVDVPVTVRHERRIDRDTGERGRTRASVIRQLRTTVEPAHAAYVEPTKPFADLVLLNAGPLAQIVEVAATVIRTHVTRRTPADVRGALGEDVLDARRRSA